MGYAEKLIFLVGFPIYVFHVATAFMITRYSVKCIHSLSKLRHCSKPLKLYEETKHAPLRDVGSNSTFFPPEYSSSTCKTEDLGKIAEYATCLALNTHYVTSKPFPYCTNTAFQLADRFSQNPRFIERFTGYLHSGHKCPVYGTYNPPYDFIHPVYTNLRLSVKTTKNSTRHKISPQVIGQSSINKFKMDFEIPMIARKSEVKRYIENGVGLMLKKYYENTFHCPVLFYHQKLDECKLVEPMYNVEIDWTSLQYEFSHIKRGSAWKESTSLFILKDGVSTKSMGEFQIHNNRDCVKFRFVLNTVLDVFPASFYVESW